MQYIQKYIYIGIIVSVKDIYMLLYCKNNQKIIDDLMETTIYIYISLKCNETTIKGMYKKRE